MKDTFSTYHPIINFTYLIAVILLSMFFMHPVFLLISLISSMLYSIKLKGVKALRFNLLYMLPMLLFFVAINVLLNHRGATILLYINDKGNFHHRHYSVVSEWEKSYNKNFSLYKHIPLDKKIKAITVVQTD